MLENKLGIIDAVELARQEERLSKKRALEMFESGFLDSLEPGTFSCLSAIHKKLFFFFFDFDGEIIAGSFPARQTAFVKP